MAHSEREEAVFGPAEAPAGPTNRCLCGSPQFRGLIGGREVRVCHSGDHVQVGDCTYIYVENPADVIETVDHCWLCGGIEPSELVTVARTYPNGPKCPAYKTKVHRGCWEDMEP